MAPGTGERESTMHTYRDARGRELHVVTPWGAHSGNIPPPLIEFTTGSFAYQSSRVDDVVDEREVLVAIVHDLAAEEPVAFMGIDDAQYCPLCSDADVEHPEHDPECPWRRAVEWVEAHTDWVDVTDRVVPGSVEVQPGRPGEGGG